MEYNKKEELFDKITGLKNVRQGVPENWYNKGVDDSFKYIKNFFNKVFVPEVPQYVADWYESNKKNLDYNLWNYVYDWEDQEDSEFQSWFNNSKEAYQTIINMHQFGYKIKNEKKYLVKLIQGGQYLHTDQSGGTYFTAFSQSSYTKDKLEELDLEWLFDCPGIELEEVQ